MQEHSQAHLHAENLRLGYNGTDVIDGFEADVFEGEMLGLIGPNGAGKTTVLRALAGLLEPREGMACLGKTNVRALNAPARARAIGLVPQGEAHAWSLPVEEVVRLGRAPHRGWLLPYSQDDRDIVNTILDHTGLDELRHRPIDKLSGGERQRVMIARALAQEPRVLLLDEPTANLDIHHENQVLSLVRDLVNNRKLTAVLAIHNLGLAAQFCDRLLLLHNKRAYAVGKPEEVLTPENLRDVFGIEGALYRDPFGQWALSVRSQPEQG